MSVHRSTILAAPSIALAQAALSDVLVKHPGISGKSYRRLVRAVDERTAAIRSEASRKAAATRAAKAKAPAPITVKPIAITKTRARKRELVAA